MTDTIEAPAATTVTVDPVTTEVLRNFFSACAEDMNAALFRSAYSSIIYEGRDCAVALLDADGDVLGMSTGVPIFLGNLEVCVRHTLATRGREWFAPGDVVIMNDPYLQGSHMHDFTVFGPIFHGGNGNAGDGHHDGELVGFAASRAHWQDVGAITTGTTMGSTEVYQEGFRLAPTKVVERYQPRDDWFDFLERNSRFGTNLIGDLNAQIAACRVGERRVAQVLDRVGLPTFLAAKEAIFRQADVLDRQAIAALPDGTYRAEGSLDDDGAGTGPLPVVVTVTIDGETMVVDLAGTHPQVQGPVNCGLAQTVSAIRLGYRLLVNTHVPITGGSFPTLEVRVPDDCLFNAKEPAACEWYFSGLGLLADLMVKALAPAIGDDRAAGAHYGDSMVIGLDGHDPRKGGAQFYQVEPTAGGWGGHAAGDGESALINLTNGSFKNIPVEVYETASPVRIDEFSLRPDTGGPGRHRGGCGVTRVYRMLADGKLSVWFERSVTPAWGIAGGGAGAGPEITVDLPDGTTWRGLKVSELAVPAGSVITIRTGGGGGWGPPDRRDPEDVRRDVREGAVTVDGARRDYGVTITSS